MASPWMVLSCPPWPAVVARVGGQAMLRLLLQAGGSAATFGAIAWCLCFSSRAASVARVRKAELLLLSSCGGGFGGPWSLRPRQQIPSDAAFRLPLSPARRLALLRLSWSFVSA